MQLKEIEKIWETTNPITAHIKAEGYLISEEKVIERFIEILQGVDVQDKTVLDYGCGGGYLGKYLLGTGRIKKYIGLDIASRSVQSADERLKEYPNREIIKIDIERIPEFINYPSDIFIALAVLIHFPTEEFVKEFLNKLNNSNNKLVILEIRDRGIGTKFKDNIYKTHFDLLNAYITDETYITSYLTNYILERKSEIHNKSNCQILYYKRVNI